MKELERLQHMEEETQRLEEEEARRKKEEWLLRDAALHSKFLYEKHKKQLQEQQQKKQEVLCNVMFGGIVQNTRVSDMKREMFTKYRSYLCHMVHIFPIQNPLGITLGDIC